MTNLQIGPAKGFEEIKKVDENGVEFWSARELFELLGYSTWQKFSEVIERAKKSCEVSRQKIHDHFNQTVKMAMLGDGAKRNIIDYKLDRYACYLIAQNGDSKIEQIALAQTYFAIQTRRQEVYDLQKLEEDRKRIAIREEVKRENKKLFSTAKNSGVTNFGSFNDVGYWGLYGMPLKEIEKRKKLNKGELLDKASGVELAANLFRITLTEDKLENDRVDNQSKANSVHNTMGSEVRETLKRVNHTLPENMEVLEHIKITKKKVKLLSKVTSKRIK
jgi:DNA-damage-inducible protein D